MNSDHRPLHTDPAVPPSAEGGDRLRAQVDLILRELDALPTLPAIATRLLSLTSSNDGDFHEVVRLIESDPSMTAKVLSLCSKASMGVGQSVATVERAVSLLGFDAVRAAVLSVQVADWVRSVGRKRPAGGTAPARRASDRREREASGFDADGFWRHSIAVACAAELIARGNHRLGVTPGEAFVAGLVHDLGKPALELALPRAYSRVVELADQRSGDIAQHERTIFGLDHHTAGKRLAERWGLPGSLRDAMWLHGQRFDAIPDAANKSLVGVVAAADGLCRRLHLGWSGNHLNWDATGAIAGLGLSHDSLDDMAPAVADELVRRAEDLGLAGEVRDHVLLESVLAANRQLGRLSQSMRNRSGAAERRATVLAEIEVFLRDHDPRSGVVEVLAQIGRSAARLLSPGTLAALYQSGTQGDWVAVRFGVDGEMSGSETVEADDGGLDGATGVIRAAGGGGSAALGRWVMDRLGRGVEGARLRVMPIGASAVLVHDREDSLTGPNGIGREMAALAAVWASSIGAAAEQERSGVLGEQLAQSNLDLARAQEELARAQSMARLGELTAGAAHEMNNPLTVISGRAQTLAARLTAESDRAAAHAIVEASHRLSNLITRLNLIAAPPAPVIAGASLADLLALVVRDAKDRATTRGARAPMTGVRVVIESPVPPVRMDRDLMHSALIEIVANAIESGPREPIEIRVEPPDGLVPEESDADVLVVRIIDTGSGMDAHALEHAFDPFFSSKSAGRQPGLGLATARRLLELHGGRIRLASTPGVGTTAEITLPRWRWRGEAEAPLREKRAA
ncbi:MAG: HDOD domain-containing protein [Phycisphaeraceae bacterium]|nr:HDOD domain-containing protein [Phycisphaeraceae bacterium]